VKILKLNDVKKYLTAIILLLAASNLVLGQTHYLNLIEKEKYSKAEKKINKGLLKTPDDIVLNYTMSTLLVKRKFKKYNCEKAYEYLTKTKTLYLKITYESEIVKLNKSSVNKKSIDDLTDTICRTALEDAIILNTVDGYQRYLDFYLLAAWRLSEKAVDKRNIVAYAIASKLNTVESYQYFITKYPSAAQLFDAKRKRNALAFAKAKDIDNIISYEIFISEYPEAIEKKQAVERIHELAFTEATKKNTAKAYKGFIDKYPQSKQYAPAYKLFEEKQFFENTIAGNLESFKLFIENYSNNSWIGIARDSIYSISKVTENANALKYCVGVFTGNRRDEALLLYHNIYTNDGETATLDLFYNEYDDHILDAIKTTDYEIAEQGNQLQLHLPNDLANYSEFDNYIRLAAPREKAFVAIQRMIAQDINQKKWENAINKIKVYNAFFGERNKKLIALIKVLEKKWDNSIKTIAFSSQINTKEGGEYVPVITADEKYIYFCGRNRKDNIGGEDIYMAIFKSGSPAKVVSELSSANSNDAPVSISTDGTSMMLFKDGKLYNSDKTNYGWNNAIELSNEINSSIWQCDAMISSDGNALIFSTIREGNYDYYINLQPGTYHGESEYASDIYVSLKTENDVWATPVNLGPTINTIYCDRSPFLHPDMKTLYFSSSGHGGIGKLDVFKTTRLSDSCWDCWSEPINMGKEINTEESDWGYKISTDGEKAYFSKKKSAKENEDIYWLNLPPHLRPDFVATVSGKLLDINNKPVAAEIKWEDLQTGKSVGQSKSDPSDGSFFIVLPLGKIYGYYINKDEYFPISNNLDLRNNNKPIEIVSDIKLVAFKQMIEEGTAVSINNLFFNFGKYDLLPYSIPELKRVAKIINNNNLKVEINGHTDNIGDDKNNQVLSEKRAGAVKDFLITEGCSASLLTIVGFGKTQPIASNDNENGRAKNRRVELKFVK